MRTRSVPRIVRLAGIVVFWTLGWTLAHAALLQATYLGGRGDDAVQTSAIDAAGNIYVAGSTTPIRDTGFSAWFPTTIDRHLLFRVVEALSLGAKTEAKGGGFLRGS